MKNACSFLNLTKNNFVLYFSKKKRMRKNKKEKLFLVNSNFLKQ